MIPSPLTLLRQLGLEHPSDADVRTVQQFVDAIAENAARRCELMARERQADYREGLPDRAAAFERGCRMAAASIRLMVRYPAEVRP